MSSFHRTGLNRKQRRDYSRLLLQMRSVYPGDPDNALYKEAKFLNPKLPDINHLIITVTLGA